MGDFSDRVFEVVRRIPRGKVATYGQVGRLIGAPRSARYVWDMRCARTPSREPRSTASPATAVVFKDGGLCKGFAFGGPEVQREMLEAEGSRSPTMRTWTWAPACGSGRMDDADDPTLPMAPPERLRLGTGAGSMTMEQGYVQVYTGDGKGKTTAAVGLAMRAAAANLRVCFCQFVKCGPTGELDAFRLFGDLALSCEQFGTGDGSRAHPMRRRTRRRRSGAWPSRAT